MVQQVFIGPLIHSKENGELIVKKRVAIFIKDGKVTIFYYILYIFNNIFHVLLIYLK
jgi:hypothetical protein